MRQVVAAPGAQRRAARMVKILVLSLASLSGALPALAQPEQAPNPYGAPYGQPTVPPPPEEQPPPEWQPPPPDPTLLPPPVVAPPPGEGPPPALLVQPKPVTKSRFLVTPRVSFGYIYAVEDHLFGANLALDLLGATPKFAGGATLQVDLGKTLTGLTFAWLQWGARFRWGLSPRVRLGFGFNLGFLFFERATVQNDPMKAFTFGPDLESTIDLVQFSDGRGLFLSARGGFSVVLIAFQPVAGYLSAGLGFRF